MADNQDTDLTPDEIHAVRERLKSAVKGEARRSERRSYWTQQATLWDAAKFFLTVTLPLLLALFGWGWKVEGTLARHELIIQQQAELLRDNAKEHERYNNLADERGQRLARIEAKIDIFLTQQAGKK